jgi:hypothetical protein
MNKPPKRHHYVPQFFLKAWGNDPHVYNVSQKRWFQPSTANIALENNLYILSNEIESSFITPYIDGFDSDIKFAQNNQWKDLSVTQKEYIYKFIILLDARNPNSIKQMKDGCKPFIPQLEKILNTKDSFEKSILDGAKNGVLILVLTAIHELGLNNFIQSGKSASTFKKLQILINILQKCNNWPLSYLDFFKNKDVFFDEFIISDENFLCSNSPVFRHGKYDEKFTVAINLSPLKAYFISNENKLIEAYKKMNHIGKIDFFNTMTIKESSFIFSKKKNEEISSFIEKVLL